MRKPLRLRHLLAVVLLPASMLAFGQSIGVGINATGAQPNLHAILDLDVSGFSVKRGLLIPRMTEAQRLAIPVVAADNGLLVYQTDTGAVNTPDNPRGFWYYSSQSPVGWHHLASAKTGWSTRGNTITNVTTQHFGTANLSPNRNLLFRTAMPPANPAMQMGWELNNYKSGFVGLGTPAPATERLEVQGAIHLARNASTTTPLEGTIRYGTIDGLTSGTNWHWGTLDTLGVPYWGRLENAEDLIAPPSPYAKDTLLCSGATGDVFRGNISPVPVTATTNTPCNVYSPFATNFPAGAEGDFRVQYLYRNSELVEAGLCFPATISAFAFYALDEESLSPLVNIGGEIRGGPPSNAFLQGINAFFGPGNTPPQMDNGIQASTPKRIFSGLTPSPGWINFALTTPITLPVGANLIIDIVWTRNNAAGLGPKVELEDPNFLCTKWALKANSGTAHDQSTRDLLDDNPALSGAVFGPAPNPHTLRPVTRFTGNIVSHSSVQRTANIIQYDGGLMIGSPAWVAGSTFRGPGSIQTEKGVYDAGLLLSDHVFDSYFDGAPRPEDAQAAKGYAYVGLSDLRERLERDRHLPNMPSRAQWEATGGASLGAITTGLWQSVENQGLYISQLEKDLSALEEMAFGTNMPPQEARRIAAEIQASRRLTAEQKRHLIEALNDKARPATGQKP